MINQPRYQLRFSSMAKKDIAKLSPKLKIKLKDILFNVLRYDPYQGKKLIGDLEGSFSYRLTLKDRIVYSINDQENFIHIERAHSHYGQ